MNSELGIMNNETRKIQSFTEKAIIILALIIPYFLFLIPEGADAAGLKKPPTNLGLVGYWSMNEGSGSFAGDSSGNKNTGTLTNGPTWVDGKRGKALSFDGSDDYVNVASSTSSNITNAITISGWINVGNGTGTKEPIFESISGHASTNRMLVVTGGANNNRITIQFDIGGDNNNWYSSGTITRNTWIHIVYTFNGSLERFYINGVFNSQNSKSGTIAAGIEAMKIGWSESESPDEYFNGLIDDVRIYNRALSATEIQALYKSGAAKRAQGPSNLGLVGYWSFDDGTTTVANDSSGNRNHGRLTNMDSATDWMNGKRGKALDFDGSNDRVVIGDPVDGSLDFDTGSFSYGMWINPASFTGAFDMPWFKGGSSAGTTGYDFELGTSLWVANIADGTTIKSNFFLGSGTLGKWTHIFAIVDRSTNRLIVYVDGKSTGVGTDISAVGSVSNGIAATIGSSNSGTYLFRGLIDDVRVYNRALSAAEVSALYESTYRAVDVSQNNRLTDGLVGFWSFNGPDMSGVTAYDRSGNNNNGTLTNGPALTYGKVGQALSFDGVNDWIDNITQPAIQISPNIFTVVGMLNPGNQTSRFITPNSAGIDQYIQYDATNRRLDVGITEFADINNRLRSSTSGSMPIDTWTHWAVSINNKNIKIYINGVLNSEFNESIDIADWTGNWRIGQRGNSTFWYKGKLDEVRIYNRVLTPDEIKRLYNMGR